MKTLIISVDYPLPEDKGNRMRTMHFVRFFRKHGEVDLMCYKSHAPKEYLESPFRSHYFIEMASKNTSNYNNYFASIYDKIKNCKPYIVNNFTAETIEFICDVIAKQDYDVILCRYSVNAYPLLGLPDKYKQRVVLDIDDLMTGDLYDAMNGSKKGVSRIKAAIDKMVFNKYQMKCLKFGKILFCSEDDKLKMKKHSMANNMLVIPNIVPKQEIPENYINNGYDNKYLLFVGTLSYQPNEMGILRFIQEIFEKLPEKFGHLRLMVVGKDPSVKLIQFCSQNSKIELIANPPDVLPYFEKCCAMIVPVLVGGGTRIKILEAGNCFRPVISTVLGAYGLGLEDYKNILYYDDIAAFIEKMIWLENKENYESLVLNLSKIVKDSYSESRFEQCLKSAIVS